MNASELRTKSTDELENLLVELSRESFNLKMQKGIGQLTKPDRVKKIRRSVARIHTILNEKVSG